ncbi:hypothetical protein BG015_005225 [Linnemannia schmuckeri]|uniref:F-box domain-containing protein n=1 Tax=Linnemannia schmuckeri TaxID=64567 RepID=A0A9P5VCG3_9FUNG|nr:hypothetical protein BG015_005225 [Linnemannia schmuckeri]
MPCIVDLPPEVMDHLGDFIHQRDITNIVLVSQHFRRHFSRLVWKEVSLKPRILKVDVDTLRANAASVRSLHYCGHLPVEYFGISFPSLSVLKLETRDTNRSEEERAQQEEKAQEEQQELDSNWARLVRLNSTIRDINISMQEDPQLHIKASEFWEAVGTSLHNPRRLKVGGGYHHIYQDSAKDMFWRAVSRFEEVEYSGYDHWQSEVASRVDFSRLKRLAYHAATMEETPRSPLEFISRCRGLTTLRLECGSWEFPAGAFLAYLERSTWPLLDDLTLDYGTQLDEDFSAIIRELPPLKQFRLEPYRFGGHWFGPQSFGYLGRCHFATLRNLNMGRCASFSSRMALVALQNCHLLEEFSTQRICVFELASSRPWVCLGLKRLASHFNGNLGRSGIPVFTQLSRLTNLEEIDTSVMDCYETDYYESGGGYGTIDKGPQWRLDQGLERLSTLTQIRKLTLNKKGQDLVVEDLEWMLKQWPLLDTLAGNFSSDPSMQEQLVAMVEKRDLESINFALNSNDDRTATNV